MKISPPRKNGIRSLPPPLIWGGLITVIFFLVLAILAGSSYCETNAGEVEICVSKFEKFLTSSPNEIGDTLAGIAGSLAFLWIIITVLIQAQELKAQREVLALQAKELKAQREVLSAQKEELTLSRQERIKTNETMSFQLFESTFFSILTMHNDIVNGIDLVLDNKDKATGRDCFKTFYNRFNVWYSKNDLEKSYRHFWNRYQQDLGHYFRFLYRSFKFISESSSSKTYHGKLLRSQLSDYELLILFYNCLSKYGKNFQQYAIEFELFDNLPLDRLVKSDDYDLISQAAFGANKKP